MGCIGLEQLTKPERLAIERYRVEQSTRQQREIGSEEALDEWMKNNHRQWLQNRQVKMLALQREEIQRHKWILSEKSHRDLGSEAAFDWIKRYAADWRVWFDENVS